LRYKKEILSGFKWTFSNNIIQAVLLAVQYIVLTRYLEPSDFGVMAILLVIIGIAAIFVEMGIGDAIVQSETLSDEKVSSLLISSFMLGFAALLVTNLIGTFITNMMGVQDTSMFLFLLSLTFLMSPLFYIYAALLEKQLLFADLNRVTIFSFVVGFIVTTVVAVFNGGIYALIFGYISIEFVKAIGSYIVGKKLFQFRSVKPTNAVLPQLKYGSYISGSRLFNFMNSNFDKILIGKFLGEEILGLYSIAWNINSIPLRKINSIANSISFPVFSKLQKEPEETQKVFDGVMAFVVLLSIPLYLFLFFSGEELLVFLFGPKWATAGAILKWLSLLGIAKAISNPAGPLILAKGQSKVEMYWNMFWLIVVLSVVYFLCVAHVEIEALAKYLAISGLIVSPIWHYLVIKYTDISYKNLLTMMILVVACFLVMYLVNMRDLQFGLIINTILSILSMGLIWVFNEKAGFKMSELLKSRYE